MTAWQNQNLVNRDDWLEVQASHVWYLLCECGPEAVEGYPSNSPSHPLTFELLQFDD